MLANQRQQLITSAPFNNKDFDSPVALEDAEDQHFAECTLTSFPLTFSAKHCFVVLDPPGKRLLALFQEPAHADTGGRNA
jgi:hypothetical protein